MKKRPMGRYDQKDKPLPDGNIKRTFYLKGKRVRSCTIDPKTGRSIP